MNSEEEQRNCDPAIKLLSEQYFAAAVIAGAAAAIIIAAAFGNVGIRPLEQRTRMLACLRPATMTEGGTFP